MAESENINLDVLIFLIFLQIELMICRNEIDLMKKMDDRVHGVTVTPFSYSFFARNNESDIDSSGKFEK